MHIRARTERFQFDDNYQIIGDEADRDVLSLLVGRLNKEGRLVPNIEAVIQTSDVVTLKKLIKVVSTTASMVNSKSRTSSAGDNVAKEIVEQAIADVNSNGKDALKPKVDPEPTDSFDSGDVCWVLMVLTRRWLWFVPYMLRHGLLRSSLRFSRWSFAEPLEWMNVLMRSVS